jgi:hypothetical protein
MLILSTRQSHKTPTKTIVGAVIGVIGGLLALAAGILIMKRRRLHRVRHGGSDVNIDGDSSPGYNETADPFGMHAVSTDLASTHKSLF